VLLLLLLLQGDTFLARGGMRSVEFKVCTAGHAGQGVAGQGFGVQFTAYSAAHCCCEECTRVQHAAGQHPLQDWTLMLCRVQ
jgi:hypothetical protein